MKGQGSVKQPGHSALLGSKALNVDSIDRCGQHLVYNGYAISNRWVPAGELASSPNNLVGLCNEQAKVCLLLSKVSLSLSSRLNSFPYDIDFTPWLQFNDSASELIEIDENQS